MPLREFKCVNGECGATVTALIRHNSNPPEQCPLCESKMEQMISNTAPPKFVGSGFYSNDYHGKKPQ